MFNANRPQVHGGGVTNAYQGGGGGGGGLLGLAAGLGLGLGTGNWAPMVSNVLGPTAGSIFTGVSTGDWSQLGNQVATGTGMFGGGGGSQGVSTQGGNQPGQSASGGGSGGGEADPYGDDDSWVSLSHELASENYIPKLGQPLSSLPQNQGVQSTQEHQQQLNSVQDSQSPYSEPKWW